MVNTEVTKMASNLNSSILSGSDSLLDLYCVACQGKDITKEAVFNCEECSNFFCNECVKYHNILYNKHVTLGKENISQWRVSNAVFDVLEHCQEHKTEKLKLFCEDHNQLICTNCDVLNHRKCTHVVLIKEKVKGLHQEGDFKQLSTSLETSHGQLCQKKCEFDERMKTLEKSYKKILEEINTLRKTINSFLDEQERKTIKELDTLLDTMKASIQTDIDHCMESIKTMTCVQEDWQNIRNKNETIQFIMYRKCLDQSIQLEVVLQKLEATNEATLTFEPDRTIPQIMSTLSGLGQILSKEQQSHAVGSTTHDPVTRETKPKARETMSSQHFHTVQTTPVDNPGHECLTHEANMPMPLSDSNQVIKLKCDNTYRIRVKKDITTCCISGICEIAIEKVLISDSLNNKVKLLDQTYTVNAYCNMPCAPVSMCSIDSSLVAVVMESIKYSGIHFIRVPSDSQLIQDKTLQLTHSCRGITHHQGNLYVTSGAALVHYNVDGSLLNKLYEGRAETIKSCAVSPDGERIYLVCCGSNQLVTLSKYGTLISSMNDSALEYLHDISGIQVTEMGQVLISGYSSNVILQVDRDGRLRLAEVVTEKDGATLPISVYFSKRTNKLIVGMLNNDSILVFTTQ